MFEQNIVADRVYEGAQPFRLADSTRTPQRSEYPHEGFLANIVDCLGGAQTRSQFELDQFAEIGNKMLLRPEVPGT